jgi:hypothetical protein
MYRDLIGCEILIGVLDIPTRNFRYICGDKLYGLRVRLLLNIFYEKRVFCHADWGFFALCV